MTKVRVDVQDLAWALSVFDAEVPPYEWVVHEKDISGTPFWFLSIPQKDGSVRDVALFLKPEPLLALRGLACLGYATILENGGSDGMIDAVTESSTKDPGPLLN